MPIDSTRSTNRLHDSQGCTPAIPARTPCDRARLRPPGSRVRCAIVGSATASCLFTDRAVACTARRGPQFRRAYPWRSEAHTGLSAAGRRRGSGPRVQRQPAPCLARGGLGPRIPSQRLLRLEATWLDPIARGSSWSSWAFQVSYAMRTQVGVTLTAVLV